MRHPLRVILLATLPTLLLACGDGSRNAQEWRTASADTGDVRLVIAATGNLRAVATVEVGAQVSGQVVDVSGEHNQAVKRGDVIARIDPANFEARVAQSQADLRSAEANRTAARANRDESRLTLANATRQQERARELHGRGLISHNDLDLAELAVDQAQARLRAAEAAIAVAEAAVGQRQAGLDNARVDLAQTVIRAPVDGVILSRTVEPGQTVASNFQTPVLFTLAEDLRAMQLDLAIDEADIGQIRIGQPVSFTVDAYPQQRFTGEVREVRLSAQSVQNVVSYPVIVSLANPDLRLYPGMTATAEIEVGARQAVLRAPNSAFRFTPPAELQPAASTAAAQGAGGGRGGPAGGGGLMALAEGLSLTAEQRSAFQAEADQVRERMVAAFAAARESGNADAARQQGQQLMRAAIERLKPLLDDSQREQLDAAMSNRQQQRNGVLWRLANGQLQRVPVRLGLSDNDHTEVVAGELAEGDVLVLGPARGR